VTERHGSGGDPRLEQLEHEAAHARRRYELHKQKVYGPKPGDPVRLRELRRERDTAESRLSRAEGAVRAAEKDDTYEQDVVADSDRIELELKRDPNRADTKVARAAHTPFTRVREVRERLGLYFTRGD
jgi:hypothetical protein